MLFEIKNYDPEPVLDRIFAQLAYDRAIAGHKVPHRFTLILSGTSLFRWKESYKNVTAPPMSDNIKHMGDVKYMGFDLSIEGAHNWPDDKIALIRNQDLIPKGPGEVIFKDFYPYVYTRHQIRKGDGTSWSKPDYYQYVTIAQFEKKGAVTVIDKSFLWCIELTGSRWCIVQEEHFSPFEYAVCVYEPDYYRYVFAVLPFDVAVRFCSDHALEKLQISINGAGRKNL